MSKSWISIFLICCLYLNELIASTTQVHPCPPSWELFNDNNTCFFINHDASVSWREGQVECQTRGSNLTSIHSQEEQDFLKESMLDPERGPSFHYLIGLNDIEMEKDFKWNDGTELDFTDWYEGRPNNVDNEDCAGLWYDKDGLWNDLNCDRSDNAYICRIQTDLNVYVCEHGERQTLNIACDHGRIKVKFANYGRLTRETCGTNSEDDCTGAGSLAIVEDMCNNKSSCSISASNNVFTDPCRGIPKYLEVRYSCEKEAAPLTTMVITPAEKTSDGSDIVTSETTLMITSAKITTKGPDVVTSERSSVVAPVVSIQSVVVPVVSTLIPIIIVAGIIICLMISRRRKQRRQSASRNGAGTLGKAELRTIEIPNGRLAATEQDQNGKVSYVDKADTSPFKVVVDDDQYANINDDCLLNKDRNDPVVEIYATSEYGGRQSIDEYANPDVIIESPINDDCSHMYASVKKVNGRDEEVMEEEGWADNEIFASETVEEGWEDNTIYVDSDKVLEGKD